MWTPGLHQSRRWLRDPLPAAGFSPRLTCRGGVLEAGTGRPSRQPRIGVGLRVQKVRGLGVHISGDTAGPGLALSSPPGHSREHHVAMVALPRPLYSPSGVLGAAMSQAPAVLTATPLPAGQGAPPAAGGPEQPQEPSPRARGLRLPACILGQQPRKGGHGSTATALPVSLASEEPSGRPGAGLGEGLPPPSL